MSTPLDRFRLDGQTIAVTGASSGFGHHFAGVLASAGARVVLGARRVEKIEARVEEIRAAGGEAIGLPLDVTNRESLEQFLDGAWDLAGRLDCLIQNAGVEAGAKTFDMIDEEDWDFVLDTNLKSVWLGAKLYAERVKAHGQEGGNIVNVGSISAIRTIKGQFPYAVSKAGLHKATEVLALEAAKLGIRVNTLAPGYILTDVSRVLLESPGSDAFRKGIPQRRYGEFGDLDGPLLLLASEASTYMTGSTVVVDGGHVCSSL
ncbi:SDR family oxidoreductase [Myxococcota bacterium]|jgi:NAD(P)-dependent dehydrogenase (short-subunit alcohol dehydrogenase family)|nr:SDR family oxidoreductase [Myxococcota bacterium]